MVTRNQKTSRGVASQGRGAGGDPAIALGYAEGAAEITSVEIKGATMRQVIDGPEIIDGVHLLANMRNGEITAHIIEGSFIVAPKNMGATEPSWPYELHEFHDKKFLLMEVDEAALRDAMKHIGFPRYIPLEDLTQDLLEASADPSQLAFTEVEKLRLQLAQRTVDNVLAGTTWIGSADLGAYRREPSSNPSMTIKRWLDAGSIFAIKVKGNRLIPAYALDELGEPVTMLKPVLAELAGLSGFKVAAWFESPSSVLDGKRPRELLAVKGLDVAIAARAMMQGPIHG